MTIALVTLLHGNAALARSDAYNRAYCDARKAYRN